MPLAVGVAVEGGTCGGGCFPGDLGVVLVPEGEEVAVSVVLGEVGGGEGVLSGSFVITGTRRSKTAEDNVSLLKE